MVISPLWVQELSFDRLLERELQYTQTDNQEAFLRKVSLDYASSLPADKRPSRTSEIIYLFTAFLNGVLPE
jgi:hypothetical protein